jgi:ABC-type amino acid transport substrate-binding protein
MPLFLDPYIDLDEMNEAVGLGVDVFRAVADVLGLKLEIQPLGVGSIFPAVNAGRADVGMAGIRIVEQHLAQVSFVTRYLAMGLSFGKAIETASAQLMPAVI